jgi:hypothetical protein
MMVIWTNAWSDKIKCWVTSKLLPLESGLTHCAGQQRATLLTIHNIHRICWQFRSLNSWVGDFVQYTSEIDTHEYWSQRSL